MDRFPARQSLILGVFLLALTVYSLPLFSVTGEPGGEVHDDGSGGGGSGSSSGGGTGGGSGDRGTHDAIQGTMRGWSGSMSHSSVGGASPVGQGVSPSSAVNMHNVPTYQGGQWMTGSLSSKKSYKSNDFREDINRFFNRNVATQLETKVEVRKGVVEVLSHGASGIVGETVLKKKGEAVASWNAPPRILKGEG